MIIIEYRMFGYMKLLAAEYFQVEPHEDHSLLRIIVAFPLLKVIIS